MADWKPADTTPRDQPPPMNPGDCMRFLSGTLQAGRPNPRAQRITMATRPLPDRSESSGCRLRVC